MTERTRTTPIAGSRTKKGTGMNNCIILKHFNPSFGDFIERTGFHDIIDFNYRDDEFGGGYVLNGFRLDEYTSEEIPISYIIGFYENDFVYYKGRTFYTRDFPALVTIIHNRNVGRDLEVLE